MAQSAKVVILQSEARLPKLARRIRPKEQKEILIVSPVRGWDELRGKEVWKAQCPACNTTAGYENTRNEAIAGRFRCTKCGILFEV